MLTCLVLLSLVATSCSKDDIIIAPIIQPTAEVIPTAFTILPDPNVTINNLQVGNRIEYNIKIQNFDNNPNVVYVLKPVSGSIVKHQLRGTDYFLQSLEANDTYVNRDSIVIKNTNSKIHIQILKPGTFQHEYTLQKMVLNKKINPEAIQPVLFNAVKINVYTAPLYVPGIWSTVFIFSISDGEQIFDNYLTNSASKSHSYSTIYAGAYTNDVFNAHTELFFRLPLQSNSNFPPVPSYLINEIKITQTTTAGSVNTINYNNIYF